MKKLIEAILMSTIGKAVLSLILKRFLDYLKNRVVTTVHGASGVVIVKFIDDLEGSLVDDFIEGHDPQEVHDTLKDYGVKDDTKKKGFLSGIFGGESDKETEDEKADRGL